MPEVRQSRRVVVTLPWRHTCATREEEEGGEQPHRVVSSEGVFNPTTFTVFFHGSRHDLGEVITLILSSRRLTHAM